MSQTAPNEATTTDHETGCRSRGREGEEEGRWMW